MDRDEAAFLASIRARPDDDLPRLVMADWFEERGEVERAEFIRTQVELAANLLPDVDPDRHADSLVATGYPPDDSGVMRFRRFGALRRRERELFENGRTARWGFPTKINCTPFPDAYAEGIGAGAPVGFIRRGFVEEVRCDAPSWLAHGDDVCQAHPVRRVTLTTLPEVNTVDIDGYVGLRFAGREKRHDRRGRPGYAIPWMLAEEWPGVAFTLPPEPPREITRTYHFAALPDQFWRTVAELTGRVNATPLMDFPAGGLLYLGANVRRDDARWRVTHRWQPYPLTLVATGAYVPAELLPLLGGTEVA